MKSRNASSNGIWLLGLFVLVLVAAGGAIWMLQDDPAPERPDDTPTVTVTTPTERPQMELPDRAPVEVEPSRIDVPVAIDNRPPEPMLDIEDGSPTSRIGGRVVGRAGQPVADAKLTLFRGNPLVNANFPGTRQLLPIDATTDEDGNFVLDPVPIGKDYVVVGEHPDYARTELGGLRVFRDRPTDGVTLRMELGATITGRVLTVNEAPIAEARVELHDTLVNAQVRSEDRRPWKIVFTDGLGQFSFEHVSAANLRVRVEAPGFESQTQMISYALEARPKDHELEFLLNEGLSLTGEVVDDRGRGVAGARLEVTSLTKDYQGNTVAFSDDNGQFLLDGMGPHFYQLRATAEGYSDVIKSKVDVTGGHIVIEMLPRLAVEGWVRNAAGEAIPSFTLTLMRSSPGRDPALMNDQREFTSAEGAFRFDNLDPGSYALESRANGYAPSHSESFSVSRSDSSRPQLVITMSQGGTLQGTVFDANGSPVKGAVVQLNPNNHIDSPILGIFNVLAPTVERKIRTRSKANGKYMLKHIMPGTYQISVKHGDHAPRIINDVAILDDDVGTNPPLDVGLPAGAKIAGRAFDENSQPLAFAEVQISQTNGFMEAATTDKFGSFNFENLTEGTYTLTLRPDKVNDEPLNPLLRLVYAQRSRRELYIGQGQAVSDVELYLKTN